MEAMNVDQLRRSGNLNVGDVYKCVYAPSHSKVFTLGKEYKVFSEGALESDSVPQRSATMSKFVKVAWAFGAFAHTTEAAEPDDDVVESPAHYNRFTIQPMEFCMRNQLPGHVWNVVKYVCRAGFKAYPDKTIVESEIIDLEKAVNIAQKRIRMLKGEPMFDQS